MTPTAVVAHSIPGRLRLKVAECRGDAEWFAAAREALRSFEGVESVEANPTTGSILVRHAGETEPILVSVIRSGLLSIEAHETPPQTPRAADPLAIVETAAEGMRHLLAAMVGAGGGTRNTRGLLAIILMLLAARQAVAGHLMAPAVTLLWYAVELLGPEDDRSPPAPPDD